MSSVSAVVWGDASDLVQRLERPGTGVTVVRACIDLPEVLGAVGAGLARSCILAGAASDLDGAFLEALQRAGGRALVLCDDTLQRARLVRLGVRVLPAAATAQDIATALRQSMPPTPVQAGLTPSGRDLPSPRGAGERDDGASAAGGRDAATDDDGRRAADDAVPAQSAPAAPSPAAPSSQPQPQPQPQPRARQRGRRSRREDNGTSAAEGSAASAAAEPAPSGTPPDPPPLDTQSASGPVGGQGEHAGGSGNGRRKRQGSDASSAHGTGPWRTPGHPTSGTAPDSGTAPVSGIAPVSGTAHPAGRRRGRITVVWGSGGAPGRSTLAANLAVEAALAGAKVALVDADTHAASLAGMLGLLDETAGLVRLCRGVESGDFDPSRDTAAFARLHAAGAALRFTSGLPRPERWAEVSAAALRRSLNRLAELVDHVVVDVAAPVGRDDELALDTFAPQRNDAALCAIGAADQLLAVGTADPVGLPRLVRVCEEAAVLPAGPVPLVVVNKLRASASGPRPEAGVRLAWQRFGPAALVPGHFLPWDLEATDAALLAGRALAEAAPRSQLRRAVADLAAQLLPAPADSAVSGDPDPASGVSRAGAVTRG